MLDDTRRHWIKEFSAVTSENNNNNIVEMKCLAYLVQCNLYCFSFNTKERIFFSIYPREGEGGGSEREREIEKIHLKWETAVPGNVHETMTLNYNLLKRTKIRLARRKFIAVSDCFIMLHN